MRIDGFVVVIMCSVQGIWATDHSAPGTPPAPAIRLSENAPPTYSDIDLPYNLHRPVPWIHNDMPPDARQRLVSGFSLAVQRLDDSPRCRGLFHSLGADWFETLGSSLYFPVASQYNAKKICRRRAAYSYVGGPTVFLCRVFSRQTDQRAAVCVIHEALHQAGLEECPRVPSAMRSRDINRMIVEACGLD